MKDSDLLRVYIESQWDNSWSMAHDLYKDDSLAARSADALFRRLMGIGGNFSDRDINKLDKKLAPAKIAFSDIRAQFSGGDSPDKPHLPTEILEMKLEILEEQIAELKKEKTTLLDIIRKLTT